MTEYNADGIIPVYKYKTDVDDAVSDFYSLQETRLRALVMEARAIEQTLIKAGKRSRSVFRAKHD